MTSESPTVDMATVHRNKNYTLNMGLHDRLDYQKHFEELTRQLLVLRSLFSLNESLSNFRVDFDEYLNANEFELALDRLCDFLVEPTTPKVPREEIEKIGAVYRAMNIGDDRISALRAKSQV
jgi:hypothetical protein